jgi:acetylglutamate synthase
MKVIALCGFVALLQACSFVSPNANSQYVALVKPNAVGNCKNMGETTVKTLSKVVIVPRSGDKQFNELLTLAKNQAVVMEGDTVVAKGAAVNGEQTFGVYRCK